MNKTLNTTPPKLRDIYKPIQKDLEAFADLLQDRLHSRDAFLQELSEHLLAISGKHLRPAVTLFCSRLSGCSDRRPVELALAIELLHTATLIHDDIVDESMNRRNQPSFNAKWGNDIALIYGDRVYAKAYQALTSVQHPIINQMFAKCAVSICEGELNQLQTRSKEETSEESYLSMIYNKTAVLFECAAAAGGYLAELNSSQISNLATYGRSFGMMYQILDDCLDIMGMDEVLGKESGADFAQNDLTLPIIYLAEELKTDTASILSSYSNPKESSKSLEQLRDQLIETGCSDRAMKKALSYSDDALESIQSLPPSDFSDSLTSLISYTLSRYTKA